VRRSAHAGSAMIVKMRVCQSASAKYAAPAAQRRYAARLFCRAAGFQNMPRAIYDAAAVPRFSFAVVFVYAARHARHAICPSRCRPPALRSFAMSVQTLVGQACPRRSPAAVQQRVRPSVCKARGKICLQSAWRRLLRAIRMRCARKCGSAAVLLRAPGWFVARCAQRARRYASMS